MADNLKPRDVGPQAGDPVTDHRDGAPGTTKAASLDHALSHTKADDPADRILRGGAQAVAHARGEHVPGAIEHARGAPTTGVIAQPRKSAAAQAMTDQFHRSGLPAGVEVVDAEPEGVELVKVGRL